MLGRAEERTVHRDHFRRRLDQLRALEIPTLIVAADAAPGAAIGDYPRAAAALAEVAEEAEGAGVRIAIEFRKGSGFCACLETASALVSEVGSANVGVCLDLFHYFTGPSKFDDFAGLSAEAASAWVRGLRRGRARPGRSRATPTGSSPARGTSASARSWTCSRRSAMTGTCRSRS